jgi:glycine betaine/proline transport system substrate-binding protein
MGSAAMRKTLSILGTGLVGSLLIACSGGSGGETVDPSGVLVQPARADWSTGYFQEALYSRGLEALGYEVADAIEVDPATFYPMLSAGDVDFWANGWFPIHDAFVQGLDGIEMAGRVLTGAGGGYLIDKAGADEFSITSLGDFARADVRAAYDSDGNDKANLVACDVGWGCAREIGYHLDELGLRDYIDEDQGKYDAILVSALERLRAGEHVLLYTWWPSWMIKLLRPGELTVVINLPRAVHPDGIAEERLTYGQLPGAVTNPVVTGFPVSDIHVMANRQFLAANAEARRLFEVMSVELTEVSAQNALMQRGEDTQADIERHVDEWISEHGSQWDRWLDSARDPPD